MVDANTLKELEEFASHLATSAGQILVERFHQPLDVQYKSEGRRDPVTAADRACEEYLKKEITRRFPEQALVAEETPNDDTAATDFVWILDPLDGTTNYLNGLPIFGVSIGVLHRGRPVVGAIFTPSFSDPPGTVTHARLGGGAYRDQEPVHVFHGEQPDRGNLSALPAHFWRAYRFRKGLHQRLGEVRSVGSITYEMAYVACGVFQYAIFGRPHIWDVAAGVVIVREAGGTTLTRSRDTPGWVPLEQFYGPAESPSLDDLRHWNAPILAASPTIAAYIAPRLGHRRYLVRRLWRSVSRALKRHKRSRQAGVRQ